MIISERVVIRAVLVLILVGVTKQVSVNLALVRISEVVRMHVDLFVCSFAGCVCVPEL